MNPIWHITNVGVVIVAVALFTYYPSWPAFWLAGFIFLYGFQVPK